MSNPFMPQTGRVTRRPGPYAELPPAKAGVTDFTPEGGSLANSGPTPAGRGSDPRGAIDRMLRHTMRNGQMFGDPRLAMQAGGMQLQQGNLDQARMFQEQMAGQQLAAQDARLAAGQQHDLRMFGLGQGQREMEFQRKRQMEEEERMRPPVMGTQPLPGTDYAMPWDNGSSLGVVGNEPPPGGGRPAAAPAPVGGSLPFQQGGGVGMFGMNNLPWVPGAPAPYLPKLGEKMPTLPMFGMEQVGGSDVLYQNTPQGQKYLGWQPTKKPEKPKAMLGNAELARLDASGFEHTGQWMPDGTPQIRKKAGPMETVTTTIPNDNGGSTSRTQRIPQGQAGGAAAALPPVPGLPEPAKRRWTQMMPPRF